MKAVLPLVSLSLLWATSYNWPCLPFDQPHWVNGTFCECRSGSSGDIDHFHSGIDIDLPGGNAVFSVIDGTVTSIGTPDDYGINSWVRVGRYAYVHVIPNPILSVGSSVTAYQTILGWTNSWNHIHFKDGYPGDEINPIRQDGGITPLDDPYDPWVNDLRFYLDGTQTEFPSDQIYGRVDIVSRAMDHTDDGPIGWDNGVYAIGYEILDSAGTVVRALTIPFQFDHIPSQSYVHNVYAPGSNTSVYRYIVTNHLSGNHSLDVTGWSQGTYVARVIAWDPYGHVDTLSRVFRVTESDTIPPPAPRLAGIRQVGTGFQLHWEPSPASDLAGYRLYFSYDLEEWQLYQDEVQLPAGTDSLRVESFPDDITIYLRMTARDNAPFPNESAPSEIAAYRGSPVNRILIMENLTDDHTRLHPEEIVAHLPGWNYGLQAMYTATLPTRDLNADLVIFLTGRARTGTLTPDQITLWTGHPVWVLGAKPAALVNQDSLLLAALPGWNLFPDDTITGNQTVQGVPGTSFADLTLAVVPDDSIEVLTDNGQAVLVTSAGEVVGAWSQEILVMTLLPDWLPDPDRHRLVTRTITSMLPTVQVESDPVVPAAYRIEVFPNPFNPGGWIRLSCPEAAEFTLYNLRGQLVYRREVPPAAAVQFHIPSHVLRQLSSGIYLGSLRSLTTDETMTTTKMVLLK